MNVCLRIMPLFNILCLLGTSAKIAGIFRKPKEQEKKVKGGEEKGIEIGVGTGTKIDTRGLVFHMSLNLACSVFFPFSFLPSFTPLLDFFLILL